MNRFAATALIAVLLGLLAPFGVAGARAAEEPPRLKLDITEMTPRYLTSTSATLGISGKVTNVGDRRITEIAARLQLGERQGTERQLAAAMADPPATDAGPSRWFEVAKQLEPNQSAPLSITVRLDGSAGNLQVTKPGVYPLLVNVNGTPEYGGPARLAALNMLLPVLGAPGKESPSKPDKPTPVSLLWPIADTRPRVVAAPYNAPVVLTDDQLAADLAPGGRLDALVTAAQGSPLTGSMCFAVDPDLLDTVDAMTRGYQVAAPGGLVSGRGVDAAKRWLGALSRLVKGQCVLQLPYADASLPTLGKVRGAGPDLIKAAVGGRQRVRDLIGTAPLDGVVWPDGSLDSASLGVLAESGAGAVITDSANLTAKHPATSVVGIEGTPLRAQPADSLLTSALAGPATRPEAAAGTIWPTDDPDITTQNALGVLAFRGGLTGAGTQSAPKPLLFMPPHRWTAPAAELTRLLNAISDFQNRGLVSPVPLQNQLTAPVAGMAKVNYTARDVAAEPPAEVTDELARIDSAAADVRSAMSVDPTAQVDPGQLVKPIRDGLLRAGSSAWRGEAEATRAAAGTARGQLDELTGRVSVVPPATPYSLASGSSPVLVFVSSRLPVYITVRITLENNTGLRPAPIPDLPIPANGGLQQAIPAEALRAGRFTVDVSLSTPGGTRLGSPATFDLRSNEYGPVTLIVTGTAAAALVLLSGRRIYRRIRARKAA
ncbi:DUF6049 family protein [Amycolatopsis anabasis]|uniref:DUF6049 family protein n=1 Tax=Amycolatopsis anabasis TaxID=1840409 RepID=UPI00131DA2C8|nr:DUF6049 family protein [Amycolatopsis anabasis]